MRLFVALPFTDAAREDLAAQLTDPGHPGWHWTRAETWHVTLAFLGQVEEQRVEQVEREVAAAAGRAPGPVTLSVGEVRPVGRRMIWLDLDDDPPGVVVELGEGLQEALAAAGLPVDRKPVAPHVTVARWRGRGRRAPSSARPSVPAVELSWTAAETVLYRSRLGREGARYEALAVESLG